MKTTFLPTEMKKVQIKWRIVLVLFLALVLAILLYKLKPQQDACRSYHAMKEDELSQYCNFPSDPAQGDEGAVPTSGGYSLKSVYMVIRHGDRANIHSVPGLTAARPFSCRFTPELMESVDGLGDFVRAVRNSPVRHPSQTYAGYKPFPDSDDCPISDLTPEGAAQQFRNGRYLRKAYVDQLGLTSADDAHHKILVRATNRLRTFQSSVAFLHGFLDSTFNLTKLRYEMAENNTMCMRACECPAIVKFLDRFACNFYRSPIDRSLSFKDVNDALVKLLGVTSYDDLPRLWHVFDVMSTSWCHDIRLRANSMCVDSATIARIHAAVNANGRFAAGDAPYRRVARLKMAPLLREIAERIESADSAPRFVLYSAHDTTIDPLSTSLGVSDGRWPKYAARIVFELYERAAARELYVRILLDGVVVTGRTEFCAERLVEPKSLGLCPANVFLEFAKGGLLRSLGEERFEEACAKAIEVL